VGFLWHLHTSFELYGFQSLERGQLEIKTVNGKAIPLQALTGPEGSRRLRFPDFKTIGT
jgi:hypothetical protein